MTWLIGDLQACDGAFERLLALIDYSPSRHRLWLAGDLVGRGHHPAGTLRRAMQLGAHAVLGNHDLHLLAVAAGLRQPKPADRLDELLAAPDRALLLDWLSQQPLTAQVEGWLLVHAGLLPAWTAAQALTLGEELGATLRDPAARAAFLPQMMGNTPEAWHPELQGAQRLRVLVNAFTRLRFVHADARMDFAAKDDATQAPPGLLPWFDHPARASAGHPIAFGHWSTLGLLQRADLLALDTGCVWGGALSAARLEGGAVREIVQLRCEATLQPGAM